MTKKNEGKRFEEDFQKSCEDFLYVRFQDSNKFGFGNVTRFTLESPCDCFIYDYPNMFFFELKSTEGTSLSFVPNHPWEQVKVKGEKKKSDMIKPHQVKSLIDFSKSEGVEAGLIINLRERQTKTTFRPSRTFFLEINKFVEIATSVKDKKSISADEIVKHGMEIEGNKKVTRFSYNVESLLNMIRERMV